MITDKEKRLLHIFIKNIINNDFNNIIDILNLTIETKLKSIKNTLNFFITLNIINNNQNQDYMDLLDIIDNYFVHNYDKIFYSLLDVYICIDYYCLKFNNDNCFNILNLLCNIYNKKNFNDIIIKICKNSIYYSDDDISAPTNTRKHMDEILIINFYELFNYDKIEEYLLEHNYDN
jgi:hypothetical protein